MRTRLPLLLAFLAAVLLAGTARAGGLVERHFDAADFSAPTTIDNRYWPLAPGTAFTYFAEEEDECVLDLFEVTGMVKSDFLGAYAGLEARVIRDTEWLDLDCDGVVDPTDRILEDTFDWYAQDDAGNVWYLGEDTTAYEYDEDGILVGTSKEGSFEAGSGGAEAGLIMLAEPQPGDFYQQEFLEEEAEDRARVKRLNASVSIELGEYEDCLVTKEWTPLEPGTVEHKFYCPWVGLVQILELSGGKTVRVEPISIAIP